MNKLTCRECPYFWTEDDEEYPSCHYNKLGEWDPAPCEQPSDSECDGDCDQCKYAYYETDHGYAYEESKIALYNGGFKMNKELIKQQLDAFEGWLKLSCRIALIQCEIADVRGDERERECQYAIAEEYGNIIEFYSMVKHNILKLMEENNE